MMDYKATILSLTLEILLHNMMIKSYLVSPTKLENYKGPNY